MVHISTGILPKEKPRYLMGVGFAEDLVVCSALGCDMYDCVFPTRTAVSPLSQNFILSELCQRLIKLISSIYLQRFGCALLITGQINLKQKKFQKDYGPIDPECS